MTTAAIVYFFETTTANKTLERHFRSQTLKSKTKLEISKNVAVSKTTDKFVNEKSKN